jgi:flagellar biosynthesis chaperone FliJ
MSGRSRRVKTLLRVAAVRRRQAEIALGGAERNRRDAVARQEATIERLRDAANPTSGSVSSLDARRQRTDLRIDAVLDANRVAAATAEEVEAARLRWQAAARNQKSMEELDRREKAVLAVRATRAAERAVDDALRARRPARPAGGTPHD